MLQVITYSASDMAKATEKMDIHLVPINITFEDGEKI